MLLKDKVVVVIGGAGLLGSEFTKEIAKEGGIVIIADKDEHNIDKTNKSIKNNSLKENISSYKIDITSKKSIKNTIFSVVNKYKKIDAIVNTAYPRNKNYGKRFEEVEFKDFCENINLHLGGYFLVSQQFAEFFKKQGYGNIINIASIYGVIPPRFEIYEGTKMTMPIEYNVIKHGIISMTKYIAKYYKGYNIRANCISPGGIFNNQPEKFIENYNKYGLTKGILNKNDINGTLVFLLSDMSKYINGQNIIVDDGWTL